MNSRFLTPAEASILRGIIGYAKAECADAEWRVRRREHGHGLIEIVGLELRIGWFRDTSWTIASKWHMRMVEPDAGFVEFLGGGNNETYLRELAMVRLAVMDYEDAA